MAHGEWDDWCEKELGMSRRNANRFIRVYERFANGTPVAQLPNAVSILDALVPFSDEELTQPHTIPSTGETKTVDEMTVRELREVKRCYGWIASIFLTHK